MDNKCCLNCKHFSIWDDDPCCLHEDGWKIILPSEVCENHDYETREMFVEENKALWNRWKKQFFNTYSIEKQDLIDRYLAMFPEDKDLINCNKSYGGE